MDTWAAVAVAIGTIGAVAYALFRDLFVTPRRRPRLELRLDGAAGDHVVRLRVANQKGKDTADDVVVVVTEVRQLVDADERIAEARPIELPLTWTGSSPPLTVASVHPASERRIDLLHVDAPPRDEVAIGGGHHTLDPGVYEISAEVRARNADTKRYAIRVVWDGSWTGKTELKDHLRVEQPRKVR